MPKVLSRTPAWLSRPKPGFELFQPKQTDTKTQQKYEGPRRTIAHRGSEVFVAVGKELRWADLSLLKDAEDGVQGLDIGRGYRILRTGAAWQITQLTVSPDGSLIAVLTKHTCHVCILPPSGHLRGGDDTEIRLKSFQLGPTAHVLEQSPLASALWHPLSRPSQPTLVTVTRDACVRLWELNVNNRSSFDSPGIAVDLKKLANATSTAADFSASKYGTKPGFSPDAVEMEVAAAAFGGSGLEDENGWASMTLWFAMTEGDVYALCPFLPSHFILPTTTLPGLSTSVIAKTRAISRDTDATETEKRIADAQTKFLADLDDQEPSEETVNDFDVVDIYTRPERPGPVAKLQGPFQLGPEPDFGEITDIHVVAPVVDQSELYDDDFDAIAPSEGLSAAIICLVTGTEKVHVCLDLDGVEAEWLPAKRSRAFSMDDVDEARELLLFETIDLASSDHEISESTPWPTFAASPLERYEAFLTTASGVYGLDFKPWLSDIEAELANPSDAGNDFRLDLILESNSTLVDRPISFSSAADEPVPATATPLLDPSLGYFLLTSNLSGPHAATLDQPMPAAHPYEPETLALPEPEPHEPYQPARQFFSHSQVDNYLGPPNNPARAQLRQPLKFDSDNLRKLTETHRILSHETNELGAAASDLFIACSRLRDRLIDQVRQVRELAARVDRVTGDDERDSATSFGASVQGEVIEDAKMFGSEKIEHRTMVVESNTRNLNERVENLRRKMLRLGGKELSTKEVAFAAEIERLDASLAPPLSSLQRQEQGEEQQPAPPVSPNALLHAPNSPPSSPPREIQQSQQAGTLASRFAAIDDLQVDLIQQATETMERLQEEEGKERRQGVAGGEYRKRQMAQVMALLERESVLVEAVTARLGRLGGL